MHELYINAQNKSNEKRENSDLKTENLYVK